MRTGISVLPKNLTPVSFARAVSNVFPDIISLPNGLRSEGIAIGRGTDFFAGSLADGTNYVGDLRTGQDEIRVPVQQGRLAVGLIVRGRKSRSLK